MLGVLVVLKVSCTVFSGDFCRAFKVFFGAWGLGHQGFLLCVFRFLRFFVVRGSEGFRASGCWVQGLEF